MPSLPHQHVTLCAALLRSGMALALLEGGTRIRDSQFLRGIHGPVLSETGKPERIGRRETASRGRIAGAQGSDVSSEKAGTYPAFDSAHWQEKGSVMAKRTLKSHNAGMEALAKAWAEQDAEQDASPDVTVYGEAGGRSTVFIFTPRTPAGREWIAIHVAAGATCGAGIAVENRYAGELAAGMIADGLVVR
jgi:hypothetical protein